jgi:MerR-like DNA binding protein
LPENFTTFIFRITLDFELTQSCRLSNMDTLQTSFTIQEAAEMTGLTEHTLRYYERIGLLMPIGRAANGL